MKKKIIAFILCACLICSTCIRPAYAIGAEGIIIGGGAAAAGITLTMPQVALIIAAGYGLIFTVQHADDIAALLDEALTSAAGAVENGIDKLTEWKDNALKGSISLSSAPSFVLNTIKNWAKGFYNSAPATDVILPCETLPAGTPHIGSYPLGTPDLIYNKDVTILRGGKITTVDVNGNPYINVSSYCLAVSTESFNPTNQSYNKCYTYTIDGIGYYYRAYSSSTSIPANNIAGNNKLLLDAVSALCASSDIPTLASLYPSIGASNYDRLLIRAWHDSYFDNVGGGICPDVTVGGLGNVAEEHGIDNINLPDINVGESDLLIPDVDAGQSIDDVISDTLTKLKDQEMEWTDYINDVAVGTPSVSIPQEDGTVLDFPITDVGVGDVPLDVPVNNNPLGPYSIDLTQYFPFCIPFDVVRFVNILCAEPEAPSFEWEFTWFDGSKDSLVIDLSPFDTVAQLLRNMEILLFIIGLALITREQIRG